MSARGIGGGSPVSDSGAIRDARAGSRDESRKREMRVLVIDDSRSSATASAFAKATPTSSEPTKPGPWVTAMLLTNGSM
mgnify:CR=1 FL=1